MERENQTIYAQDGELPAPKKIMLRLRNSPALSVVVDSLVAFSLAVSAILWVQQRHIPDGGLVQFLKLRITLFNSSFAVVFIVLWKQCFVYFGLHDRNVNGLRRVLKRTAAASAIMTTLLACYLETRHIQGPIAETLAGFFLLAFLYETCRAVFARRPLSWQIRQPRLVVIIGSGRRAAKAWRELRLHHRHTRQLLGFMDDRALESMPPDISSRFLGNVNDLQAYLLRNTVDEVILAAPMRSCYDLSQRAVSIAEAAGVRIFCLNDTFTFAEGNDGNSLFVRLSPNNKQRAAAEAAKRILDVIGATLGLLVLSPLFLSIALALKVTSPGSIFSIQEQYGYGRRRFRMFHFRSVASNIPGLPLQETKSSALGRLLRRTLLDELPELWNVLLGDMSLVGPRPMSEVDVSGIDEAQLLRRFSVRPGITGTRQTAEPAPLSMEQRVALDFFYIDQWSLALDLKILARTLPAMLKRSGAVS